MGKLINMKVMNFVSKYFYKKFFNFNIGHSYLSFKFILSLRKYLSKTDNKIIEDFEHKFSKLIGNGYCTSFAASRMGFFSILKTLKVGKSDEIIITGSTCAVMVNAIIIVGAKPVYSDIDLNTFGSCPESIKSKISSKTKMIIAQHTLGIPCKIEKILEISKKKNIFLLEDCALSLGSKSSNIVLGNFGDAAIFSTDHSKPLNTLIGGMVYTKNIDLHKKINTIKKNSAELSFKHQKLIYLRLIFEKLFYNNYLYWISKIIDKIFFRLKISFLLEKDSTNKAHNYYPYPAKMPLFLAKIGLMEINRWENESKKRLEIFNFIMNKFIENDLNHLLPKSYFSKSINIVPLRFIFSCTDNQIRKDLGKFIDISKSWFLEPIISTNETLSSFGYNDGECPVAELKCPTIINLPCIMNEYEIKFFYNKLKCLNSK